mgnify:CR=1
MTMGKSVSSVSIQQFLLNSGITRRRRDGKCWMEMVDTVMDKGAGEDTGGTGMYRAGEFYAGRT